MSTTYPSTLDNFAAVPENQALTLKHRERHQNAEDAIEAIEAFVGTSSSPAPGSINQRLTAIEGAAVGPTVVALEATTWGTDTIPVGTGVETCQMIALTANSFVAKASTGSAAAKTITDQGLSLVANSTPAQARATIDAQQNDATLTALAVFNTNGLMTQTAPDTFTGRAIAGTAGRVTVTNGDGVSGNPTINIPATLVDSGKFTPAHSALTNISTSTPREVQWLRVGNTVHVTGRAEVTTTTAAGTATSFEMTLPVTPAPFVNNWECAGTGGTAGVTANPNQCCLVLGSGSNARVQWQCALTGNQGLFFAFSYRVA